MIHKKGGRIRTYGRPAPDLLGWVAGLAPLVALGYPHLVVPHRQSNLVKYLPASN